MIRDYKNVFPIVHPACYISESSEIIGDVTIGERSSIWPGAVLRGDLDIIRIGAYTNIQDATVIHVDENMSVQIGSYVTIGHGCILHGCTIDDNSLIGMGSIILNGAKIGQDVIVGAGTLITSNKEIPDGSLVLGSPGKIIRKLTEQEIIDIKNSALDYAKHASEYI
ncbi:MAG: gamma carbonic anhydrase family protein [Clostridia bacterium]|nr:gamma carbonic anhydrase family protein [Clostridia bacterium]